MKHLNEGKILIIPDWHQNINFCETALAEPKWDKVVFLGDEFDCFEPIDNIHRHSMEACCLWINKKFDELGNKAIWLLGNHTLSYIASYKKDYTKARPNDWYRCSGVTSNKVKKFSKYINPKWFQSLELCVKVGDTILSHAGFHCKQFQPFRSEEDNILSMYHGWESVKSTFMQHPAHWIWDVGPARWGKDSIGSPIWLDWTNEFIPLDHTQQLVGHTNHPKGFLIRTKGINGLHNYCIDCDQNAYAIWENGEFTFVDHYNDKRYTEKQIHKN
jgi:hypothetical protein